MPSQTGSEEEQPPDPTLIRLQKRIRRLMLIGGLTLGLGVGAVMVGIIYRFFFLDSSDNVTPVATVLVPADVTPLAPIIGEVSASAVGLSSDAELLSVTLEGNQMALAFREGGDLVTVIVDTTSMKMVGQFRVKAE